MKDDDKPFGAENIRGAESIKGAENIRGRENLVGAEDRPPKEDRGMLAEAATAISAAAGELLVAAKLLERLGWTAARVKEAKGHPIELWGKDEALQELPDRLKAMAAEITAEGEAQAR